MSNKVAFNPEDRFVVTMRDRIMVTTRNGSVFGHDVSGGSIGPAFQFSGSRAAFNPQDRFVVTIGDMLIVTTENGGVFGHEVSGDNIGPPFQFSGSRAAFNPGDRFVVTIGNMLIVTTQNGDVFGHDVSGRDIGPPFKFSGSRMAFNPEDRFVFTIRSTMIVTTRNGNAFGAIVAARNIGPISFLNPDDEGRAPRSSISVEQLSPANSDGDARFSITGDHFRAFADIDVNASSNTSAGALRVLRTEGHGKLQEFIHLPCFRGTVLKIAATDQVTSQVSNRVVITCT